MDVMKQTDVEQNWEHSKPRLNLSGKPRCAKDIMVFWTKVHKNVKKYMQETVDKLDDRAMDIAEKTAVIAPETCNVDQNKAFMKGSLRSTLNRSLVSVLNDPTGNREFFDNAIIQMPATPK